MSKKIIEFKSTKGGKFSIELQKSYEKIKLPYFKQWINALESGRYRQCRSHLCRVKNKKASYCCLGLLSKIQGRLVKDEKLKIYKDEHYAEILSPTNPCHSILQWSGTLPMDTVVSKENRSVRSLATCNDVLRLSFKDIAKIIKTLYKE